MSNVSFEWHMDRFEEALDRRVENLRVVTRQEMVDLRKDVEVVMDMKLEEHAHPPGTRTSSLPGEPPGTITGRLASSLSFKGVSTSSLIRELGSSMSNSSWGFTVGPTAVYARIQELGGWTGEGHKTYLPARPYFKPTISDVVAVFKFSITRVWRNTWSSGF